MNCREFQKRIPEIISDKVSEEYLIDVVKHVEKCKDCYDELEIYFVLEYGLKDDDNKKSMNLIGRLNNRLRKLRNRADRYYSMVSLYNLIKITAYTAIAGLNFAMVAPLATKDLVLSPTVISMVTSAVPAVAFSFAYVNPKPRQQVYTKNALSPRPGACAIGILARKAIKKQPTAAARPVQIYIAV